MEPSSPAVPGATPRPKLSVPLWTDILSGWQHRCPALWRRLGNLESKLLAERLQDITITKPIYISGLARSGTTILLELLARHPYLATHRYRDFPPVHTPWLWNWFVERAGNRDTQAIERAHGDGIAVSPESPEAFEEVLWMAFFPDLHVPDTSSILSTAGNHAPFEQYYRDHIRKMLLVRGGRRYLSKANYNLTRLPYLLQLFPDARFILPVREPANHIASLMSQHARFCHEHERDNRLQRHMSRCGHFEFGLDRRPINCGNEATTREILQLWSSGHELEGWTLYWCDLYGYIANLLQHNSAVRRAAFLVDHHQLCHQPVAMMEGLLAHCELPSGPIDLRAEAATTVRPTPSSRSRFSAAQLAYIDATTSSVRQQLQQFYFH